MATEYLRCKLLPGINLDDESSAGGKAWAESRATVLAADGVQRLSWGLETENPDVLRLFIDWDSVEAHKNFEKTSVYGPFKQKLAGILDFPTLTLFHVPFAPFPATSALHAPATEILTVHFPRDHADRATWEANLSALLAACAADSPAYRGHAGGWAVEDAVAFTGRDGEPGEGRAYVAVVGWESVDAHLAFRGEKGYTDNIGRVRGTPGVCAVSVVHANLRAVEKAG